MKKFFLSFVFVVSFCVGFDRNLQSIQAKFVQYTHPKSVYYSGSFLALSPHYAKWEYIQPIRKIVYLDGKNLISYEPTLNQAIYTQINQTLNFLKIIQSSKQDEKDPNLYLSVIDDRLYKLYVKEDLPSRLEYEDALGNLVVIELSEVKLNPHLSQEQFIFAPPKGIDIIKQEQWAIPRGIPPPKAREPINRTKSIYNKSFWSPSLGGRDSFKILSCFWVFKSLFLASL